MARVRQARRCTARRTNGEPCRAYALLGAEVCWTHGGAARQVRQAAQRRVAEADVQRAADAAIRRYLRELKKWQVTRILIASALLDLPPEAFVLPSGQVNGALLAWCRRLHGGPEGPESAPTLRPDRRFAAVRALESGGDVEVAE